MVEKVKDLYIRYGAMVFRRCAAVLRDDDEAFDATQDVFVLLLQRMHRYHITSYAPYLYRMATHHSINILKKRGDMIIDTEFIDRFAYEEDVEQSVLNKLALANAFKGISPLTRVIAGMKYGHGLKYSEISQIVGLSVHAVRKRLQVLRKAAQRPMEEKCDAKER